MRRLAALLCALCLLGAAPGASATAERGSESFSAGSVAFAAGDFRAALAAFLAARAAGMEEPAVLYNIGVCHYRLGEFAAALRAFLELRERHPVMAPLADYNVGLARWRLQDATGAAAAFRRTAAGADPKLAALAARMLERIEPPRPPAAAQAWSAFVDLTLGFDDNVALVDEASLAAGESTDSPFASLFGQVGRVPAESGFGGTASGYLVRYPDAGSFDQEIAELAGAWFGALQGFALELGPHVSFSTLGGDRFERRLGARIALDRGFEGATRVAAELVLERIDALDDRFAFIEGSRTLLGIELERRVEPGRIGFEYAFSVDDRDAASVSPVRHRFTVSYRRPLSSLWSLAAAGAYRASRYDDLPEPRDEDRSELAVALYRELPESWQLALEYRLTSNASSVDVLDYDRHRIQLGVYRVFP